MICEILRDFEKMAQSQNGPFDEQNSYRSLALVVETRKFFVPRETLAGYSPVFETMFYGNFTESTKDTIPLPGKKAKEIEELLLCLIPTPKVKPIDDLNVDLMLEFAEEYQIEDLKSRCETFLVTKLAKAGKGNEALLVILRLASKHRLRQLLDQCIKRCSTEFSLQELQPIFGELRSEVIACLMLCKNSALPVSSTCKFEVPTGGYCYCLDQHRIAAECLFCENVHCFRCGGSTVSNGLVPNVTCTHSKVNRPTTEVERSVRALLDRI